MAALLAPASAQAAPAALEPLGTPGDILTMPLQNALKALPLADEDRTGYQRISISTPTRTAATRAEALKTEAFMTPEQVPKCKLTGGRWYSAYDDQYIDGASGLDVDHRVPTRIRRPGCRRPRATAVSMCGTGRGQDAVATRR
ncbi:hypothetical protein [Streptomyces sp. NBC_01361]|uniref:hypothetical protein n=1 Tax=Streptomyces sp. NBC_01361 TaxID=2903838 RepID=UPI002E30DE80|nr:hypothetical protein [Streptomyces sp. NBC_01361]